MFKLFRRKDNNVMGFIKNKDIELANAYRTNSVSNIKSGLDVKAMGQLVNDIAAHAMDFGFNSKMDTDKYIGEELTKREYSVISESDNEVVIKRDVKFRKVKSFNIMMTVADDFSEVFTISKNDGNFTITNIAFAQ